MDIKALQNISSYLYRKYTFYWHMKLYRIDLYIKELTTKLNYIFSGHNGMKLVNHKKTLIIIEINRK